MTEEWNLSDKVHKWKGFYNEKDVKEFIRLLKKELGRITFANEDRLYNLIDKLAGSKLVEAGA